MEPTPEVPLEAIAASPCRWHPAHPATEICSRCGTFTCLRCTNGEEPALCPDCQARAAPRFHLRRESWSAGAVFDVAWSTFQGNPWPLVLAAVVMGGAQMVGQGVTRVVSLFSSSLITQGISSFGVSMAMGFLAALLGLGQYAMSRDALLGKPATIETMLSGFGHAFGVLKMQLLFLGMALLMCLPVALLVGVFAMAGLGIEVMLGGGVLTFLVLLPAWLWLAIPLQLALPELFEAGDGEAMAALRRAFSRSEGQRLRMVAVGLVGLLVAVAGLLMCCVGLLPAMAVIELMRAATFLATERRDQA